MATSLPIPVTRALRKLGDDMKNARLRRRIGTSLMAERAGISRATLLKIEKGFSTVSLANYASVLFVLGMIERLSNLVDITHDRLALDLEEENLPKRIRRKKYRD